MRHLLACHFGLGLRRQAGDGGWQVGSKLSPSWTLSSRLTLFLEYNYNRAVVENGIYGAHVGRFRMKSALNRKLSASAFIQYNSDLKQLLTNIRLRYNPSAGMDLYVVYNEGINTSLGWEIPRLPRTRERTILIKYNYTFVK